MKLQAVTVCINYADYLLCILNNRIHFDRWVIVTAAGDEATIAFCQTHGLEWIASKTLFVDGSNFDATRNKSSSLNEGIDTLDQEGWCLIIDADVMLPKHFRQRLEALTLEVGAIYGPVGRRLIDERVKFELLLPCEPWDRFLARYTGIIGYFQLFHLAATPNRYWPSIPVGKGPGDDDQFQFMFPPDMRLKLPFSVIHVGKDQVNWTGRRSDDFSQDLIRPVPVKWPDDVGGTAVFLGYFPNVIDLKLAKQFETVFLVDRYGVHTKAVAEILEEDRASLRKMWDEAVSDHGNIHCLGHQNDYTCDLVPDHSVDFLYLPGEPTADWLCEIVPLWLPKLKSNAIISGQIYGLPYWPDTTYAIALLFGSPDAIGSDGWWKRYSPANQLMPIVVPLTKRDKDGLVLVGNKSDVETLILGVYSARRYWSGVIQVFLFGRYDDSLRTLCARKGAELRHVSLDECNVSEACADTAEMSPLRNGIFITPGVLICGPVEFCTKTSLLTGCGQKATAFLATSDRSGAVHCEKYSTAEAANWQKGGNSLVAFSGSPENWTEDAWEEWCILQAELAAEIGAEVRIPDDTTVLAIVDEKTVEDFQRNWLTWKFPPSTPVILVLVGISNQDLWLADVNKSVSILCVSIQKLAEAMKRIASECGSKNILILSANAQALPGAEVRIGRGIPCIHATELGVREFKESGNLFIPNRAGCVLIEPSQLCDVAECLVGHRELERLCKYLYLALQKNDVATDIANLSKNGWTFPTSEYSFVNTLAAPEFSQSRVSCLPKQHGLFRLADDVRLICRPDAEVHTAPTVKNLRDNHVWFRPYSYSGLLDNIVKREYRKVDWTFEKRVAGKSNYIQRFVSQKRAHAACLKEAADAEVKSLLIIEDGVMFRRSWEKIYREAISELPANWLQLYLVTARRSDNVKFSRHLELLQSSVGVTAILYSQAGIQAALRVAETSQCELDVAFSERLNPFGFSYILTSQIAKLHRKTL